MKISPYITSLWVVKLLFLWMLGAWGQPLPDRRPLHGQVTDEGGLPVRLALVSIQRHDLGDYTFWGDETITDEHGNFSFKNAEVGRYDLTVTQKSHVSRTLALNWNFDSPQPSIRLERLAELNLHVWRPCGLQLAHTIIRIHLQAQGQDQGLFIHARTNEDGEVTVSNILPGTYEIYLTTGGAGFFRAENFRIRYGPRPRQYEVQLQSGATLYSFVCQSGTKRAVGNAILSLVPIMSNTTLVRPLSLEHPASADGRGDLIVTDIPAGRYHAALSLPGLSQSETRELIFVSGQRLVHLFQVTLASPSNKELTLSTNRMSQNLLVRLVPLDWIASQKDDVGSCPNGWDRGTQTRHARSDANGRLTLYPLPSGRYQIWLAFDISDHVNPFLFYAVSQAQ